jgi:hypothetical protein
MSSWANIVIKFDKIVETAKTKYRKEQEVARKWVLKYEAWLMFAIILLVVGLPFLLAL